MTTQQSNPNRRTIILVVVAVLVLLIAIGAYIDQTTQPVLISGPMVQIPEPDAITVVWEMEASLSRGAVRLTDTQGAERVEEATTSQQRYEVTFEDLAPGADYSYAVINRGVLGRETTVAGPFATATVPPRGQPIRFVAFGDSGVGSLSQAALADLITDAQPDVVIHTGDLVYGIGAPEDYFTNFFEPNAALIRSVPFMPSLGNHDCVTEFGKPYLDMFMLPPNGPPGIELERNYWFDYGDARFVALDSNKAAQKQSGVITEEQMKTVVAPWLRDVLTDCDARWKFVFFHHPFYTGSNHQAEGAAYVKEAYVDVFEACGVDIVFAGHNHLYERTAPILRDEIVGEDKGVVYITTGAGGARRYPMNLPPPHYIRAYNDKALSFTQVDLTANRLELKQIGDEGQVLDEYVIEKATSPGA